jgi:hypothetical protein
MCTAGKIIVEWIGSISVTKKMSSTPGELPATAKRVRADFETILYYQAM